MRLGHIAWLAAAAGIAVSCGGCMAGKRRELELTARALPSQFAVTPYELEAGGDVLTVSWNTGVGWRLSLAYADLRSWRGEAMERELAEMLAMARLRGGFVRQTADGGIENVGAVLLPDEFVSVQMPTFRNSHLFVPVRREAAVNIVGNGDGREWFREHARYSFCPGLVATVWMQGERVPVELAEGWITLAAEPQASGDSGGVSAGGQRVLEVVDLHLRGEVWRAGRPEFTASLDTSEARSTLVLNEDGTGELRAVVLPEIVTDKGRRITAWPVALRLDAEAGMWSDLHNGEARNEQRGTLPEYLTISTPGRMSGPEAFPVSTFGWWAMNPGPRRGPGEVQVVHAPLSLGEANLADVFPGPDGDGVPDGGNWEYANVWAGWFGDIVAERWQAATGPRPGLRP